MDLVLGITAGLLGIIALAALAVGLTALSAEKSAAQARHAPPPPQPASPQREADAPGWKRARIVADPRRETSTATPLARTGVPVALVEIDDGEDLDEPTEVMSADRLRALLTTRDGISNLAAK